MNETIGVIGLGAMGSLMAEHLLKKQFSVVGYDIQSLQNNALDELGLKQAASPKDVAEQSDILITSLPSAAAVHAVISGEDGVLQASKPGQILIETSTLNLADKLEAHAQMAAGGMVLLDSPISGTPPMLADLQASLYESGDRSAYDKCVHVIEAFTGTNFYVGDAGDGSRMKFLANYLVAVHTAAAAECMVLGIKSGLDPALVHQVLQAGAGTSKMFELRGDHMVKSDYRESGGTIFNVLMKDAQIITEHAAAIKAPIDLFASARQRFNSAVALGYDHLDLSAVCKAVEAAAGIDRPVAE